MKRICALLLGFALTQPAFAGSSTIGLTPGSGANAATTTDGSSNIYWRNTLWDYAAGANGAAVDAGHSLQVAGEGTAGTPAGGVVSVQGVSSGTAIPVSAASGAFASGAFASGSGVDGWNVTEGTKADAAWTSGSGSLIAIAKAIATNTGAAIPAGTNVVGYISNDPCAQQTKKNFSFSTGSNGTQLIAGASNKNTYICSFYAIASAAANLSLVAGSGSSVCTSGTPLAILGGTTTASAGMSLPANGGLTLGSGAGTVSNDVAAASQGYNICIGINGSSTIAGGGTYVQQ